MHTGIHVSEGDNDPFPSGNADRPLPPQEKAYEFSIFDRSACLARSDVPPAPPPVEVTIRSRQCAHSSLTLQALGRPPT